MVGPFEIWGLRLGCCRSAVTIISPNARNAVSAVGSSQHGAHLGGGAGHTKDPATELMFAGHQVDEPVVDP